MGIKLGLITIGQSPRIDVVPEIKNFLPEGVEILEKGALDGLTTSEVRELAPQRGGKVLVTRLMGGTEVLVDERFIMPRLQQLITEFNQEGVSLLALLCSGSFPSFQSANPLIIPDKLLRGILISIAIQGKLGIIVPSERQVDVIGEAFQKLGFRTVVVSASPYGNEEALVKAARRLRGEVKLSILNCFGYNLTMKQMVVRITKQPVILVRSILARTLAELVCSSNNQLSQ